MTIPSRQNRPTVAMSKTAVDLSPKTADAQADFQSALVKAQVKADLFDQPRKPVKVGRYVLLERIGYGGMGDVFAAYDQRLDRKVALKLVRPAVAAARSDADERLLREAQSLAQLSHPNVVQVYEVGAYDGRVFLAMEFVRGHSLGEWMVRESVHRNRDWRRILRVLINAGRGVAAAHRAGIMHRDFKPGNILVGSDDHVRVVDFGLARADGIMSSDMLPTLDDRGDGQGPGPEEFADSLLSTTGASSRPGARLTMTGTIMGTPAYMAPEQLEGLPGTRRSDQFSFCVTVFEALYGYRPFDGSDMAALRLTMERDPVPPPPSDSKVPRRIWQALARGLSIEPENRYLNMEELLSALDRDPSRPRRLGALAAGLVVTGVGLGVAVSSVMAPGMAAICTSKAGEIDDVWNSTRKERIQAQFTASDLPYAATTWRTVEMLIDKHVSSWRAERYVMCESAGERETVIDLDDVLQRECLDQGKRDLDTFVSGLEEANDKVIERSVAATEALKAPEFCADGTKRNRLVPPPDEDLEEVREIRNQLAKARLYQLKTEYEIALSIAKKQFEAASKVGYIPVQAEALLVLGLIELSRSDKSAMHRGRAHLMDALDLAEAVHYDGLAVDIWNGLAFWQERYIAPERAHFWARRALTASKRIGDEGERRVRALRALGMALLRQGQLEQAHNHLSEAVALADKVEVGAHLLSRLLHDQAITLTQMTRHREAVTVYRRARSTLQQKLGAQHPSVASVSYDLALALSDIGRSKAAISTMREAIEIRQSSDGKKSQRLGEALVGLAHLELQSGEIEAALGSAERARAIYEHNLGPHNPFLADPAAQTATAYRLDGRYDKAEAELRRVLSLQHQAVDDDDAWLLSVKGELADVLARLGQSREAMELVEAVDKGSNSHRENIDFMLAMALAERARGIVQRSRGQNVKALASFGRALALFTKMPREKLDWADTVWQILQTATTKGDSVSLSQKHAWATDMERLYASMGELGQRRRAEFAKWWLEHKDQ